MKKLYFFLLIAIATACDFETTRPASLASLEGAYRTNGFLDPLCIAISDESQLPALEIRKQSNGDYKITRTTFIPQKDVQTLSPVRAETSADTVKLFYQNKPVGTYVSSKWYNGKNEVISPVLRVSYNNTQKQEFFYFAGVKR
ncbi:hypothetical protein [Telluribacter sp.]|jgi:hypothetical protein|uniref:hypothetical protein n=1 Tax=Telluribacter sp. TaxID=1978767 RepID=UPI002E0F7258|nr:hypothetical protein [Telluribacter sp.]